MTGSDHKRGQGVEQEVHGAADQEGPEALIADRWQLAEILGRGGQALVYRAHDTWRTGRPVAIKIWHQEALASGLEVSREFALLYRVRHAHVAQVLALGWLRESDTVTDAAQGAGTAGPGSPYLVQVLCEGVSADTWAKDRPREVVAAVGAQMAAALASLHSLGVWHRDVKPQNIMVSGQDDPAAVLVDFGLAARGVSAGDISGTLAYMAPETLSGQAGPAADVYGLGASLVALLTGAPPPGAQSQASLGCSYLGDIVAAMTHPDPSRRVDAAAAFELLLAEAAPELRARLERLRDAPAASTGLAGRAKELGNLAPLLEMPGSGASIVRLVGPPGIGKTALLEEIVTQSLLSGFVVPGAVRPAPEGSLAVIEQACVDVSGEPAGSPSGSGHDHGLEKAQTATYQRFLDLADRLRSAGKERPLALVFDDVPSQSPLDKFARFLARLGQEAPPVVWFHAVQGNEAPDEISMTLGPLGLEATRTLLAVARPLRPTDQEAAEALQEASGGNPAQLVALLTSFPGDALRRAASRGELSRADLFGDALATRLEQLEPAHRRLVHASALLASPVPLALLKRVGGLAVDAVAIEQASLLGLLAPGGGRDSAVQIPSEGLRCQLASQADGRQVRQVAEAVEEAGLTQERAEELGRLWLRLGESARALPHLLCAASQATASLRFTAALELYESILATAEADEAIRIQVRLDSAALLVALGRAKEAVERYKEVGQVPAAQLGTAKALVNLGRYQEAADALARIDWPPGRDAEAAEAIGARALMLAGRYDEAETLVQRALKEHPEHGREVELRQVGGCVAFYRSDMPRARALLEQALELAVQGEDEGLEDQVRATLALVHHKSGDLARAEDAYKQGVQRARRSRNLPDQILRLTNLATLQQEQGKFEEAIRGYEEAAAIARLVDGCRELVRVRLNWAVLLSFLGDFVQADACSRAGLQDAEVQGMGPEQAYLSLLRAEVALGLGDVVAAQGRLDCAAEMFSRSKDRVGQVEVDSLSAALHLFRREWAAASAKADEAARLAKTLGRDRIAAQALLWQATAALGQEEGTQQALAVAAELVAKAARLQDPDLGWLVHAAASRLHGRAGNSVEADFHLAKARQLASVARTRLSARYERAYAQVWYRRELWSWVRSPGMPRRAELTHNFDRLLAINRELAQDHDPERLLERVIDAAIALSGAERGFIVLRGDGEPRSQDSDDLVIRVARNMGRETLAKQQLAISRSIALRVMEAGVPVSSVDALGDERFREYLSVHNLNLRSVLCLPLRAKQGVLGALYLDNRHRVNAFSDADVALLSSFGDQAAIALANAQLVSDLNTRSRELERSRVAIEELNQRLQRELDAQSAELEIIRSRVRGESEEESGRHGMLGRSLKIQQVYRIIDRVADKEVTVTILGESGTGKELVARAIHHGSPRSSGPFVSINCAALSPELLESELFGHEKGSFTGAVRTKPGLMEIACGGTLFLDEVGEMPFAMQVKLLRVLQQREFRRVGGTTHLETDARFVAASNRDLEAMVREGSFREDLWYRLNVVEIRVPALRERREDIPLLVAHLLTMHGGKQPPRMGKEALACLLDYPWPGNVRELDNEIQRALALSDERIEPDDFSGKLRRSRVSVAAAEVGSLKAAVEAFERQLLQAALETHRGNVTVAAKALSLTRAGLYKKLHKHGLIADKT